MTRFTARFTILLASLIMAMAPPAAMAQDTGAQLLTDANKKIGESDYAGAIQILNDIVTKYPGSRAIFTARVNLGLAQYLNGGLDEAVKVLKPIPDDTSFPDELRETAGIYLAQALSGVAAGKPEAEQAKVYQEAADAYGKFIKAYPKSTYREDALYGQGLALLFTKKYDDAALSLLTARREFPTSPTILQTLYLLGNVYSQKAQDLIRQNKKADAAAPLQEARKVFDEIVKGAASRPDILNDTFYQVGEVLLNSEQYAEAVEFYRKVRPSDQIIAILEQQVGDIRKRVQAEPAKFRELQRQKEKIEAQLSRLKTKANPLLDALSKISLCFIQVGKHEEARTLANHILGWAEKTGATLTAEQDKFLRYVRVLSLGLQGLLEPTEAEYATFKEKFGADALADNIGLIVGGLYLQGGDAENAIRVLDQALVDYPDGRYKDDILLQAGTAQLRLGQYDEAIKRFTDYISKNEGKETAEVAKLNLGNAMIEMSRYEEAVDTFRQLAGSAKTEAVKVDAAFRVPFALQRAQRLEDAAKEYKLFADAHGDNPLVANALIQAADCQMKLGQVEPAIATFGEVVSRFPKSEAAPFAQQGIAFAYLNMQPSKVAEALAAFDKIVELFPENPLAARALIFQGSALAQNDKADEALAKYQTVLDKYPQSDVAGDAQLALGRVLLGRLAQLGNYLSLTPEDKKKWDEQCATLVANFQGILEKYPDSGSVPEAVNELVKLQQKKVDFEIQNWDQAGKYFADLAQKLAGSPNVKTLLQFGQAGVAFLAGKQADAVKIMRAAYAENTAVVLSAEDFDRFGLALLEAGDADTAIQVYGRLRDSYADDPYAQANAAFGLGTAYLKKGENEQAEAQLARLRKDYPWSEKIVVANYNLARSIQEKDPDKALEFFKEVISARTQKPIHDVKADATWRAGEIHLAKGQANEAAYYFQNIDVLIGPAAGDKAPLGLQKAAKIFEDLGNAEKARECYESLVTLYPKHPATEGAKERLAALPPAPAAKKKK
ncbi:MAG: tetratricopeptide repeat protein [Verrucomicrobiae bacterium]|nr:tetratricopeptide repeat protein [Verrucomicrobiae bacterium]